MPQEEGDAPQGEGDAPQEQDDTPQKIVARYEQKIKDLEETHKQKMAAIQEKCSKYLDQITQEFQKEQSEKSGL